MQPVFGMGHNIRQGGWRFVRDRDFGRKDIHNYYVNNHTTILNHSTVINNIHNDNEHHVSYNAGPDRKEIEKHQGKTIAQVDIKENSVPGQHFNNNQLEIYKPQIEKENANHIKPAPNKLTDLKDVKRRDEKTPKSQTLQAANPPAANAPTPVKQPTRQVTKPEMKMQQPPQRIDKPIRQPVQPMPPVKQQPVQPPVRQQQPMQPVRQQPVQPVRQQPLPPRSEPLKPLPQRKEQPKASIPASPEQYKQPVRNRLPRREVPDPQPPGMGEQIHH